jgi:target of rapamycin complex 2 subunit MAPKAP1
MMVSSGTSANPFAELYGAILGRAEVASVKVSVFFPHSREPSGKAMELSVHKDATIEEVVSFSLWTYWEEGWPKTG